MSVPEQPTFASLRDYVCTYAEKSRQLQLDFDHKLQSTLLSVKNNKFTGNRITLGDLVGFLAEYFNCFANSRRVTVIGDRWDTIEQHLEVAKTLYYLKADDQGSTFQGEERSRGKNSIKEVHFSFRLNTDVFDGHIDSFLHIESLNNLWEGGKTIVTSEENPQVHWFTIGYLGTIDYTSGHVLVQLKLKRL